MIEARKVTVRDGGRRDDIEDRRLVYKLNVVIHELSIYMYNGHSVGVTGPPSSGMKWTASW